MNAMLGKVISSHQRDWDEALPLVLAAYRASLHEATGYSPNFLMFGRESRAPVDLVYGMPPDADRRLANYTAYVRDFAERMEDAYRLVRDHLRVAAERRKHAYDMKVRQAEFSVGDRVWYYTPRRYQGRSPKWARMYTGPFTIMERCGLVNYRLRKSANARPFIAHVDKLRLCFDEGLDDARGDLAAEDTFFDAMPPVDNGRPKRTVRLPARFR